MQWVIITIILIWALGFTVVMSIMKAASDSDDKLLGELQYYDNTRT